MRDQKFFFRLVFCLVFFPALCDFFSKFFGFYQTVPPCIFWSFRFVKTFNEPEWPLFEFSALCDLKKTFFEKKISKLISLKKNNIFQMFPIVVPWIFFSLRYGADLGRSRLVLLYIKVYRKVFQKSGNIRTGIAYFSSICQTLVMSGSDGTTLGFALFQLLDVFGCLTICFPNASNSCSLNIFEP